MTQVNDELTEREYPLRTGSLIRTAEGVLFSRSSPGTIPLLTDPEVEIDDVLNSYGDALDTLERMTEALQKSERFICAIMGFYGQGLSVNNWHQNGEGEPWDNFFDENMDGDELKVIQQALSKCSRGKEQIE